MRKQFVGLGQATSKKRQRISKLSRADDGAVDTTTDKAPKTPLAETYAKQYKSGSISCVLNCLLGLINFKQ